MKPTETRHILHTSAGIRAEMFFDEETAGFRCEWSKSPPWGRMLTERVMGEYEPWRNQIVSAWSVHTGKPVLLLGTNGQGCLIDGHKIEEIRC